MRQPHLLVEATTSSPGTFALQTGQVAQIIEVTSPVWLSVRADVLSIERKSFPPSIRDSPQYLSQLVRSSTCIFLALRIFTVARVVGYLAADVLEDFPNIPGVTSDPHFHRKDTFYIASVAIDPAWRQRGLGIALQKDCLRRASQRGFERATAHVHHGALSRMGLGGRELRSFDNWYETRRTFDYVELPTNWGR